MPQTGERAPDFSAPLVMDDIQEINFSNQLDHGPIVLAFFPGAFTQTCTAEMQTFEERLDEIQKSGVTLYGISVDSPFSLKKFREDQQLSFGLLSDTEKEVINLYDVTTDFDEIGYYGVAQRAIFLVRESGTVAYRWIASSPDASPPYDELFSALESLVD